MLFRSNELIGRRCRADASRTDVDRRWDRDLDRRFLALFALLAVLEDFIRPTPDLIEGFVTGDLASFKIAARDDSGIERVTVLSRDVEVGWAGGATIRASGNSFATPHVAGMAARVLGAHPGLRPFEVKTALRLCAGNVKGGADAP